MLYYNNHVFDLFDEMHECADDPSGKRSCEWRNIVCLAVGSEAHYLREYDLGIIARSYR